MTKLSNQQDEPTVLVHSIVRTAHVRSSERFGRTEFNDVILSHHVRLSLNPSAALSLHAPLSFIYLLIYLFIGLDIRVIAVPVPRLAHCTLTRGYNTLRIVTILVFILVRLYQEVLGIPNFPFIVLA